MKSVIFDIAEVLVEIDASRIPFKNFQPGIGPYGEPQLVKLIASMLNLKQSYHDSVVTKRTLDLLIKNQWALEFKIVRPFGDNGHKAENWSVNLLHPYTDNTSSLGDSVKLLRLDIPERKGIVVVCYEHFPPRFSLQPLINSFELIAKNVMNVALAERVEEVRENLIHPVHQQLRVIGWEVRGLVSHTTRP